MPKPVVSFSFGGGFSGINTFGAAAPGTISNPFYVHNEDLSDEYNEEDDDEDDVYPLEADNGTKLSSIQEVKSVYTGRVKSLAKIYEKFAKKVDDDELSESFKTSHSMSTCKGEITASSADSAACSSSSTLKETDSGKEIEDENRRLDVVEAKVDAVVTFVKQLFTNELESLANNFQQDLETNKVLNELKTSAKDFDEELDESQVQMEGLIVSMGTLRKENKMMKLRLAQLEHAVSTGNSKIQQNVQLIHNNLCDFSNKMIDYMDRYEAVLAKQLNEDEEDNTNSKDHPTSSIEGQQDMSE